MMANMDPDPLNGCYPFLVYVEVDYPLYVKAQQRGQRIEDHIEAYLEEERKLFAADGLQASFVVSYWKTPSSYNGTSTREILGQFRNKLNAQGGHPGDLAMLLSNLASGGINYVDIICNQSFGVGYSSIDLEFNPYPAYSWDLIVMAHEIGHGLGSPHSHSCSWPGGAIDGCSPFGVEGNCADPGLPARGEASVMSYCHLQSSVGIDPAYGFGPLPLALIKNKIAGAYCVECVDEPTTEDCEGNKLIVEVLVDLWAQETTWEIVDDRGELVAESTPYPKFPVNFIHSDTLCLPSGCYYFTIKDVDGLVGVIQGYEGMYIVNSSFGEMASGQDFSGSESTLFCLQAEPPHDNCVDVPVNVNELVNYSNQHRGGTVEDIPGGLTISGNTWKAQPFDYVVTSSTVLTGEIWVDVVGEIHSIAVVNSIGGLSPSNSFRLAGTQEWGVEAQQVTAGEWQSFQVPIGQFIDNTYYRYIVFINDNDVGINGPIVTSWRGIEMCENGEAVLPLARTQVQGMDEEETALQHPYPNPVIDTLTIPGGEYKVYSVFGDLVKSGYGSKINMYDLEPGAYFLINAQGSQTIIKQ
jgi:hypothetical protein